jgi:uncharacterized protein YutE (UPF0331/DUF86 family)
MLEKLKLLEENITQLLAFRTTTSLDDIRENRSKEWALRYGFLETIQIAIDISCHLVSKYNLGNPSTYSECVELLGKFKYIDQDLMLKLLAMVGLRNLLIHEYIVIDKEKLYALLNEIDDFKDFAQRIKDSALL